MLVMQAHLNRLAEGKRGLLSGAQSLYDIEVIIAHAPSTLHACERHAMSCR